MKINIEIDDKDILKFFELFKQVFRNANIINNETINNETINNETINNETINNETIIKSFTQQRNLKKTTESIYKSTLTHYSNYHKMHLNDLLNEAIQEEINNVREVDRKIKKRLVDFYTFCINNDNFMNSTSEKMIQLVKTWYRHEGIVIPYIHTIVLKKDNIMTYEDILEKEEITEALNKFADSYLEKSVILLGATSGMSKNEILHLSVGDFIKATSDYHSDDTEIKNILKQLEKQNNIVPLFSIKRIKTDYYYNTCCTPECAFFIVKYLLNVNKELKLSDSLFGLQKNNFTKLFSRINEKGNYGKVHKFNRFRSHMLRKFNATTLQDKSLVDAIQGRKRDSVTETYFKYNPNQIKEEYIKVMHKLTFNLDLKNDNSKHYEADILRYKCNHEEYIKNRTKKQDSDRNQEFSEKNLYEQYIILNKTQKEVAKYFNIAVPTVSKRLKEYGIKKDKKYILKSRDTMNKTNLDDMRYIVEIETKNNEKLYEIQKRIGKKFESFGIYEKKDIELAKKRRDDLELFDWDINLFKKKEVV